MKYTIILEKKAEKYLYRIIYTVRHSQLIVMVIDIEHRSKVYQ